MCSKTTLLNRGANFFSALADHVGDDAVFIDRDPTYFAYVLNHLRGECALPDDAHVLDAIRIEAEYYCLLSLVDLADRRARDRPPLLGVLESIASELRLARTSAH